MIPKSKKFALIIARATSTRLPEKNKLLLEGIPLFQWTLEAALRSGVFDEVWVSSDDAEILEISSKIPNTHVDQRPAELSGANIKSHDVLLYMIEKFKKKNNLFQHFCLLQPTSPFRNAQHINHAFEMLESADVDFVVGVKMYEAPSHFALDITNGVEPVHNGYLTDITRTQDVPVYYHPAGGIYAGKTEAFRKSKQFYGKKTRGLILDQIAGLDINTEDDFSAAKAFAKYMKKSNL